MKLPAIIGMIICMALISLFSVVLYAIANSYNPNSRFCAYSIYKTSENHYEVWFTGGRYDYRRDEFSSYIDAKNYQIKLCDEIKRATSGAPHGEYLK